MSKYNTRRTSGRTKTINLAGGEAYTQSAKLELVSLMLTSFLKDQFYRNEAETVLRLDALFRNNSPEFVAKCAVYARREFGMRSVSHYAAAWIGAHVKGQTWTRSFFQRIVRRPDDVTETLSCYLATYKDAPIPNAMKRGLGAALSAMSEYDLAKYRAAGADLSMVDAVNLLHPRHTEALEKLVRGTLPPADTWETAISAAGQSEETTKASEWARLVTEKKLGYMALVRNLRNILTNAPATVDAVCEQLVNVDAIKRSLMFPFRFLTAIDVVKGMPGSTKLLRALNKAVDLSLSNVPKFEGKTLVVVDESGSMRSAVSGQTTCNRIACLFAATLVKANPDETDLMLFATNARYVTINPDDSTLTVAEAIPFSGGGTNFHSILPKADKRYDRIIILSDMQGWMGGSAPTATLVEYRKRCDAKPKVFSFDLAGHGTMQFPEPEVCCLAGFSDKVFDIMRLVETDKQALVHTVEQVSFVSE